jgi:hypothetical protein
MALKTHASTGHDKPQGAVVMIEVDCQTSGSGRNTPAPTSIKTGLRRMQCHRKGAGRISSGPKAKHFNLESAEAALKLFSKGRNIRQIACALDVYTDDVANLLLHFQAHLKKE